MEKRQTKNQCTPSRELVAAVRRVLGEQKTEKAAADALGVSRPTFSRFLAGLPVQSRTLADVAARLGVAHAAT